MGGRWRKKPIVSLKLTNFTLRRYTLQTYGVFAVDKLYNTKIYKFMGGRWRYKLIGSVKFTKLTMQRHTDIQFYGWTLALQTYSVLSVV